MPKNNYPSDFLDDGYTVPFSIAPQTDGPEIERHAGVEGKRRPAIPRDRAAVLSRTSIGDSAGYLEAACEIMPRYLTEWNKVDSAGKPVAINFKNLMRIRSEKLIYALIDEVFFKDKEEVAEQDAKN